MTELLPSGGWGDFLAWWRDEGQNRIFRMFVYKRMHTPYEQQKAYSDESLYEDIYCQYVFIREVINLGNGDYLLGVQETDCEELFEGLEYYRLSEIRLSYHPIDMNEAVELIESLKE